MDHMIPVHDSPRGKGRRRLVMVAGLGLAMIASACGSSSKSSTPTSGGSSATSGSSSTASASSLFGSPDPATGTPLKVGFISDGQSGSINTLPEVPAAQAAVKYVNAYLGGIGGHVLSLDVCITKSTPSGATDCANQMLADKVPLVISAVIGEDNTVYKSLSAAGVPYLERESSDSAQLTGKHSYIVANPVASVYAGPARVAQEKGAKRAANLIINVPAAAGPAQQLNPLVFHNAGVPDDVVPIAPGTPDMTPQVQAEISKGVDFFSMLGDAAFCTTALKAMKTLNYTGTIVLIPQCIQAGSSTGIPGGYAGDTLITSYTSSPSDPDVQLYVAALKQWAPSTPPFANSATQGGFAVIWTFARAMKNLSGAPTSANIEATLAAMPAQPMPFGAGGTFQCNGKQVPIAPDICQSGALAATLNAAGQPTGAYTSLDVSALLKP